MAEGTYGESSHDYPINHLLEPCAAQKIDDDPRLIPQRECAKCLGCSAVLRSTGEAAVFDNDLDEQLCPREWGEPIPPYPPSE